MQTYGCPLLHRAFLATPRDCRFNDIPRTHENRARVARPFSPRAGNAIHPALQKWEGSGFKTSLLSSAEHRVSGRQITPGICATCRTQICHLPTPKLCIFITFAIMAI